MDDLGVAHGAPMTQEMPISIDVASKSMGFSGFTP